MRTAALLLLITPLVAQNQVNLNTWTQEDYITAGGAGSWNIATGGQSVTQSTNGRPTLFYSDFDVLDMRVSGQITVTATDDDFAGFALGFHPGDATNPTANYLLLDWKKGTQTTNFGTPSCTPGSTAQAGIALSRVEGIPTADEFWGHVDLNTAPCSTAADKVTELVRATNLGATGWVRNQTYDFQIDYTSTGIQVWVDNVLEIDYAGTFQTGRFAFYNFSQSGVIYSALTSICVASVTHYGQGHPGTAGIPLLESSGPPVLGTQIDLQLTSAAPTTEIAALAFGYDQATTPSGYGGTILLNPLSIELIMVPVAPAQFLRPFAIPSAIGLCGAQIQLQFVHHDPGASHSFAFSDGLTLSLGG